MSAAVAPKLAPASASRAKRLPGRPRMSAARVEARRSVCDVLRDAREACKLTRPQLAGKLGVSETQIRNWEDERHSDSITLGDVLAIAVRGCPQFVQEVARRVVELAHPQAHANLDASHHLAIVVTEVGDVGSVVRQARKLDAAGLRKLVQEIVEARAALDQMQRDAERALLDLEARS